MPVRQPDATPCRKLSLGARVRCEPLASAGQRRRQEGQGAAQCPVLLHGVGGKDLGFVELAQKIEARLTVVLAVLQPGPALQR